MLARVHSATLRGIEAVPVSVEVDVTSGLPSFNTVGLPDSTVRESRDRIRAAIKNSGFTFPMERITVSLAPADIRKEGPALDLPIALGLLAATKVIKLPALERCRIVGEVSLDGQIRAVRGVLPVALLCRREGTPALLTPASNAVEAAAVDGAAVIPLGSIHDAIEYLNGEREIAPVSRSDAALTASTQDSVVDFSEVRGQRHAKRALEIAAAGGHNVLMIGPPGVGKTMLAVRLPGILPPLSFEEAIEVSAIWSVAGLLSAERGLLTTRPFRAPHHTISGSGLIGGGSVPHPGETSLAHLGVIFLDELPEFPQRVLESLRQPLESGLVTVSRVAGTAVFPARFQLVAAANPCRRGCLTPVKCVCTPPERDQYLGRISRPLLDRIDLHLELPAVPFAELSGDTVDEPSSAIRARVVVARERQARRFAGTDTRVNARMNGRQIRRACAIPADAVRLLGLAVSRLGLSARAYERVLKVARTIADLAGTDAVATEHVAEAIQYRGLDRRPSA